MTHMTLEQISRSINGWIVDRLEARPWQSGNKRRLYVNVVKSRSAAGYYEFDESGNWKCRGDWRGESVTRNKIAEALQGVTISPLAPSQPVASEPPEPGYMAQESEHPTEEDILTPDALDC